MIQRYFVFFGIVMANLFSVYGQSLEPFSLSAVRLGGGPFYEAQQTDMEYILALDPDRLLAPYVKEAGLEPRAEAYGNWESSGLDGHIGGHYLSALALMYAATGNEALVNRLSYMVSVLAACQEANGNGYTGGIPGGREMWAEIAAGDIRASTFSLNDKWVPLYNIHKLFAGLRDAWLVAGNKEAKTVLVKLSDWMLEVTSALSDEQIQEMLVSEHGGMNEVFADVYAITGSEKYLGLARRFSHRKILDPLLHGRDELTGLHANTQIPKVIGYKRIADLEHNTDWNRASDFFWNEVVNRRSVSIGGNSVREHFHPDDDFSGMVTSRQGPETCNTYNMLRLTQMLFLSKPEGRYMDFYERAMYNHILSSQHPSGGFVYFTPMRPRHYRVYSRPGQGFWCCVGSGLENHGKYGELIYARRGNDLYVNLFVASSLEWKEKGMVLTQETGFPDEEHTKLTLSLDRSSRFSVVVRRPGWVKEGKFEVYVNDRRYHADKTESSYIRITRKWKDGDKVVLRFPMHTTAEYLHAETTGTDQWVSFVHGPVVLGAVTDTTGLFGLYADDSRMGHVAQGKSYPLDEAPMILAQPGEHPEDAVRAVTGKPMTFKAPSVIYPQKYKNLELVPFYTIHDARYMVYWPVEEKEGLEEKLRTVRKREKEKLELEARTVDQVAPGEQQPETEHNYRGEQTSSGMNKGVFWRQSESWFSYDLNNTGKQGKVLRVEYYGGDKNRHFGILVNGELLKDVSLQGGKGDVIYHEDYRIPDTVLEKSTGGRITVKFVAKDRTTAGPVYGIRLLRP